MHFKLVVDDFGVRYFGEEHVLHLKQTIEDKYTVTLESDGRRFCGIRLDWDYKIRQAHIPMPNYVTKALKRFNHKLQKKTPTIPKRTDQVRSKEAIFYTKIDSAATRKEG